MSVTCPTFHVDRSWLNDLASENIEFKLVTWDTSHSPIGPYGPVEQSPTGDSLKHASAAALRSSLSCGKNVVPKKVVVRCWSHASKLMQCI